MMMLSILNVDKDILHGKSVPDQNHSCGYFFYLENVDQNEVSETLKCFR